MDLTSIIRREWHFLASLLVFVATSALLLPYFVYHLNPDAISYIDLAHAYIAQDWTSAINAYWGPLYSWLLIPLLQLGIAPLVAEKLLSIGAGVLLFCALKHLLSFVQPHASVRNAAYWALVPFALFCTLSVSSPDLLLTAILTEYIALTLHPFLFRRVWVVVAIGLVAGIAYVCKSIALPFFILHFTLIVGVRAMIDRPPLPKLIAQYVVAMLAFLLVAGPWIAVISQKVGHPTIGTAGGYIYASRGPDAGDLPILRDGLAAPAFDGATSVWAEPTQMSLTSWSPLSSTATFTYQLKLLFLNTFDLLRALLSYSALSIVFLIAALLFAVGKKYTDTSVRIFGFSCIIALCVMAIFYLPILVDPRYFWMIAVLSMPLGTVCFALLFRSAFFTPIRKGLILVGFVGSFALLPVEHLALAYNDGHAFVETIRSITTTELIAHKRVAADSWKAGLFAAYHADASYVGMPRTDQPLEAQLLAEDVMYYITWKPLSSFLEHYEEVSIETDTSMRLFKRKN